MKIETNEILEKLTEAFNWQCTKDEAINGLQDYFVDFEEHYNKSKLILDTTKDVTRVEVIDQNGRSYVNWHRDNKVRLSYQDDNRTLKVFIDR